MCAKSVLNISICNTIDLYVTNSMPNDHNVNEMVLKKGF